VLARVEWVGRKPPEQVELLAERVADGLLPAADRATQVGRNVKLDEAATDRGPEPAARPLSFEVLVEVAAVVTVLGGGLEDR
jgi:hypothetical protein